jgi:hypothetical protein
MNILVAAVENDVYDWLPHHAREIWKLILQAAYEYRQRTNPNKLYKYRRDPLQMNWYTGRVRIPITVYDTGSILRRHSTSSKEYISYWNSYAV